MTALAADVVLLRLIEYLRLAEVTIDEALLLKLVTIVHEGSISGVPMLFDWSLTQLNGDIGQTQPQVVAPMPLLRRGHMGYNRRRAMAE